MFLFRGSLLKLERVLPQFYVCTAHNLPSPLMFIRLYATKMCVNVNCIAYTKLLKINAWRTDASDRLQCYVRTSEHNNSSFGDVATSVNLIVNQSNDGVPAVECCTQQWVTHHVIRRWSTRER